MRSKTKKQSQNYRILARQRRIVVGRWPEWTAPAARVKALELRKEISEGHDPLQTREQSRGERLMTDLAHDYLERHAIPNKRASSLRNDRQMLDGIILPRLGRLLVKSVDETAIEKLHGSLKATPYRANRVLSLLSKMFSLAMKWKWRSDNPAVDVERYNEDARERWLTAKELERIGVALDNYPDQEAANAIRLLMLTGSREGEVLTATWDQFDLERGIWTKPSHHTKQEKIEHVPLSQSALELLDRMKEQSNTIYLFPGRTEEAARVTLRRPWVSILKAAGLAQEYRIPGRRRHELIRYRPTVRIHDLRHTFASHLVSRGESLHIVGQLLGHTQPSTTQRYAHVADEAQRNAANRFADVVEIGKKKDHSVGRNRQGTIRARRAANVSR